MCLQRSRQVPGDGTASAFARRFVADTLGEVLRPQDAAEAAADDEIRYDAALITAELIANAVRARRQVVSITLDVHHRFIRIAVYDDGPGLPTARSVGPSAEAGRGLRIVDSLAAHWGAQRQDQGKTVWATLDLPTRSAEHLDCWPAPSPDSSAGSGHPSRSAAQRQTGR